jgi:hypothetical protein
MGNIGNIMKIKSKNYFIEFSCDAGGILKRTVRFGDDGDEEEEDNTKEEFVQEFNSEQLCRITKLAGLSNNIQIYPGKPLLFKSAIGGMGNISIYIKSKDQIELEGKELIESDYESD